MELWSSSRTAGNTWRTQTTLPRFRSAYLLKADENQHVTDQLGNNKSTELQYYGLVTCSKYTNNVVLELFADDKRYPVGLVRQKDET